MDTLVAALSAANICGDITHYAADIYDVSGKRDMGFPTAERIGIVDPTIAGRDEAARRARPTQRRSAAVQDMSAPARVDCDKALPLGLDGHDVYAGWCAHFYDDEVF